MLPYERYALALTPGLVGHVFGTRVDDRMLRDIGLERANLESAVEERLSRTVRPYALLVQACVLPRRVSNDNRRGVRPAA